MVEWDNLIEPIPEYKRRKIFIAGNRFSVYMEDWYMEGTEETNQLAFAFAEGFKVAYEAMGICLDIVDRNDCESVRVVLSFPTKFTFGQISPEIQRTYTIRRTLKEGVSKEEIMRSGEESYCWDVTVYLDSCFFEKRAGSKEEIKEFISGFYWGYKKTGASIKEQKLNTPLPPQT